VCSEFVCVPLTVTFMALVKDEIDKCAGFKVRGVGETKGLFLLFFFCSCFL